MFKYNGARKVNGQSKNGRGSWKWVCLGFKPQGGLSFLLFPQSTQRSETWLHTLKPPHRIDDVYPSFSTTSSYAEALSYNMLRTVEASGSETLTHIQTTMWFVWNMDLNYKSGKSLRVGILHKLLGQCLKCRPRVVRSEINGYWLASGITRWVWWSGLE